MFLFGNKIEKLEKFIIKALTKTIKAGENIVALYEEGGKSVGRLKVIIIKLKQIKSEIEAGNE